MVERTVYLDNVFGSLADSTRRDILKRVAKKELSVGEIAEPYNLTFAAVSKHLKVLEKARLVKKRRDGKQQVVRLSPSALKDASTYLRKYQVMWGGRLDKLEEYLKEHA